MKMNKFEYIKHLEEQIEFLKQVIEDMSEDIDIIVEEGKNHIELLQRALLEKDQKIAYLNLLLK